MLFGNEMTKMVIIKHFKQDVQKNSITSITFKVMD